MLIVGSTGDGKSTLARYIADGLQPIRLIAVDPKGELELGVTPCRSAAELAEAIRAPTSHYVPASFDREELEQAFQLIWQTRGPWLLEVHEAAEVSSPNWCPAGLRLACTQGRSLRKMVIACTQRVTECHPVFRTQSEHIFLMVPRPIEMDLRTIAGHVRREASEIGELLDQLQTQQGRYDHVWYCRLTNEMRLCAPLPAPAAPRARAAAPAGRGALPQASSGDQRPQEGYGA